MTFQSSFPAVKPLPGTKREFPNIFARVNTGLKRGNRAQSANPLISSPVAQSVPSTGRPGTKKTLDEFVRKPFRATPVPATTYEQPRAFVAQRPLSRIIKGMANEKSEAVKVSAFRANPIPASTYKQPKEFQQLSKTKEAKKGTHPVVITKTCVADVPISVKTDVLATTAGNQDLPVVVKPDLSTNVVVKELPPAPSVAGNDQDPLVITETVSNVSTQDNTCLEDEDDDECWGEMGDWVSEL